MAFSLPRLSSNAQLVDQSGRPTIVYTSWWQSVVQAIESAINGIAAALAAALAAQNSADAAAISAADAQSTADAAAIAAANAQTTANSKAPTNNPTFTGTVTIPTPTPGDNTTKAASTAYVIAALGAYAPLASPTFTGAPSGPTATAGTNTTQFATTAFVTTAVSAVTTGFAPLASPAFTGNPTAPTQATADNSTKLATTAYVQAQGYIPQVNQKVGSTVGVTDASGQIAISYGVTFSAVPIPIAINGDGPASAGNGIISIVDSSRTTTGFKVQVENNAGSVGAGITIRIDWFAAI